MDLHGMKVLKSDENKVADSPKQWICCDQKAQAASAQRFTLWQQATRDHCIIACLRYIHMGAILRAHPVRGESHIERNTNGEVVTTSPPFYNEPHQSHILFAKAAPGTTSTSSSQQHFAAIVKPERQMHKASHCGSKQQQRSLYYCLFVPHI